MLSEYGKGGKSSEREPSLDFIRGVAVLLMIFPHTVYFVHNGSDPLLVVLSRSANAVVFTLFLMISGAATYFAFLTDPKTLNTGEKQRVIRRTGILLAGYYTVALISLLVNLKEISYPELLGLIGQVVVFRNVPSFSEFLLPFVFYSLSVIWLKPLYSRLSKNPTTAFIAGISIYLAAYVIFLTPMTGWIVPYKALLVGSEGLLTFPILLYFPVFTLGLSWGKILDSTEQKTKTAFIWGTWFTFIAVISSVVTLFIRIPVLDPVNRWPPSVGFLSLGLAFTYLLYILFIYLPKPAITRNSWRFILYLGRDSYDLYIVHMIILFFYQAFTGPSLGNPAAVLIIFTAVLLISVIFSSMNWDVSPSVFTVGRLTFGHYGRYRLRKRYLSSIIIFSLILIYTINSSWSSSMFGGIVTRREINNWLNPERTAVTKQPRWYNPDYRFKRRITVTNYEPQKILDSGSVIRVGIDLKQMVSEDKIGSDGTDIIAVRDDGQTYIPLQTAVITSGPNSGVLFRINQAIPSGGKDDGYYLYYRNEYPEIQYPIPKMDITNLAHSVFTGEEIRQEYDVSVNRTWFIRPFAGRKTESLKISLTGQTTGDTINYEISRIQQPDKPVAAEPLVNGSLNVGNFTPGQYFIRLKIRPDNRTEIYSRRIRFNVSEPVLVAWSLDWEGMDTPDSAFSQADRLSVEAGNIPFTHFFNPRILMSSYAHKSSYTNEIEWLKKRLNGYRDELALHLHAQSDFVKAAGVNPKSAPRWGYKNDEGYDVYLTAYSQDEITKMLNYSLSLINETGLPRPVGFRAGGWFADRYVLEAISTAGIKYDSSGRERQLWGGRIKSPWNLNVSIQPYIPSKDDINATGRLNINILEIPNNGGNTNEYSTEVLLKRFGANYGGGISEIKKSIVFMSHLQWADDEIPKAEYVIREINNSEYESDRGPVIFTTVDTIYKTWTE